MVTGLGKFREAFIEYADNYVIIGGTACDIVLRDTDMTPRATSDIDMIVVVENMTPEFATAFWQHKKLGWNPVWEIQPFRYFCFYDKTIFTMNRGQKSTIFRHLNQRLSQGC